MAVIVLVSLAALIACANLAGSVTAIRRQRRGDDRGYSSVPLISLLLSITAWVVGPEPLGLFVFLPALLDPGSWSILLLPWYAFREDDRGGPTG